MRGLLVCAALAALCFTSIAEATLRVGFKENELELPEGISLAGYIQRRVFYNSSTPYARYFRSSSGKFSLPLVKSLAVDDGQKVMFFVSLEIIAIEPDLKAQAEKLLAKKLGRKFELNLFATHTHSGPGGFVKFGLWQQLATDSFVQEVFDYFVDIIVDTSYGSYNRLEPARLSYGKGDLHDVSYNRRNSPFLNPQVHVLKFLDQNDVPLGTLINFPIHGTAFGPENLKVSGDIPSSVENELGQMTNAPVIFISGASGDVGPKINANEVDSFSTLSAPTALGVTNERIQSFGQTIASQIFPIWQQTQLVQTKRIQSKKFNIDLPPAQANLSLCIQSFLPDDFKWLSKLFFRINLPTELSQPMEVNMIKFPPLTFYLIPGEPIGEVGDALERYSVSNNLPNPILMTLANSYYGYILSDNEYARGGYETCNSFFGKKYGSTFLKGMMSSITSFSKFVNVKK